MFEDFQAVINTARQNNNNLYLLDVLCQMSFIDKEILKGPNYNLTNDRYRKLKVLLRSQNINLLIVSNKHDYPPPDIQQNLFRVFCAIYNLKPSSLPLQAAH